MQLEYHLYDFEDYFQMHIFWSYIEHLLTKWQFGIYNIFKFNVTMDFSENVWALLLGKDLGIFSLDN